MINRQTALFGLSDGEDRNFMSSMCDKAEKSIFSGRTMFSKFLSPRQIKMVSNRLADFVSAVPFGGYADSERCVVAFCDYGEYSHSNEYPIDALQIKTKNKTVYSHRDYLGSLMSLGISRELLGDIIILNDYAVLFCLSEISDYIIYNLTKIANTGVVVLKADFNELNIPKREYKKISKTVSSARLDCIVSAYINKSRSESADIIEKGLVCVNYEPVKSTSAAVANGDIISVRGYGKMEVAIGDNLSKKGRLCVNIKQYI